MLLLMREMADYLSLANSGCEELLAILVPKRLTV